MATQQKSIILTLPAADIAASTRFGTALGFKLGPYSDSKWNVHLEHDQSFSIFYTTHAMFSKWLPKEREIASTKAVHEMIVTISVGSNEEVDALVEKGIAAGGTRGPDMLADGGNACGVEEGVKAADHPMPHSKSVLDPDGHLFEVVFFNMETPEGKKDEN
ncbi:hypothetical protein PAAG_07875 [Paracoccidioides lutzii Pb01]|uniref:VOC domain-containing protein n=1 Tax=Paracoccidioides lutzii (strain ATCC MYA-826 / Pb01) TaxID=502779 RepID=C1HAP5_PARBA|nr:hypothetical protein PAAG_07875 [Paracoccidioides lutzii Pb01]EEH37456.1 hypothetical protein PAAG_07875 [Paracoccidioides lutzii Pb01]